MKREIHGSTSVTPDFISQAWVLVMATVKNPSISALDETKTCDGQLPILEL